MTLLTRWAERSRERFSWAEKAHEAFLGTLHEDLARMHRTLRDEATVAVFGSTQVGKTTLILRLLGVDEERMEEVSRVLRAGRAHGRSSTATAMLYGRALDDRWHLHMAGTEGSFEDPSPIEEELRRLRDSVEREGLDLTTPVRLLLPEHCFSASSAFHKRVNVIDLPGDNPSNNRERDHVKRMVELYVPNADLVILVGKVDDLGFIDPDKLGLPESCDWRYQPGRYRIVTTYTIQAASFRTWLEGEDRIDVRALRQRLLEQLDTFDEVKIPDEARDEGLYFPLEFGQSWRDLERTAPGTHAKVRPVIDELMDKLRRDIDESTTPRMRILRAREVHILANKLKRKQQQERDGIREMLQRVTRHRAETSRLREAAKRCWESSEALPREIDIECAVRELDRRLAAEVHVPSAATQEGKRVRDLLDGIASVEESLVEMASKFRPAPPEIASDANARLPDFVRIKNRIIDEFEPLEEQLSSYYLDRYLRAGSWEEDSNELRMRSIAATQTVRHELRAHWSARLREFGRRTAEEYRRLTGRAIAAEREAEAESDKGAKLAEEATKRRVNLEALLRRLEEDEAKGHRFDEMLVNAFRVQRDALLEQLREPQPAASRFIGLLSLRQIRYECDDLFVQASLTNTANTQRA